MMEKPCCSNCVNLRSENGLDGHVDTWCAKDHFSGIESANDLIPWIDCDDFEDNKATITAT